MEWNVLLFSAEVSKEQNAAKHSLAGWFIVCETESDQG